MYAAPSETPFLVAFHPFNPESGRVKKGKKSKVYFTGPFTYAAMHEFILTSSVPVVTRLPANDGPDVQRRNAQAIQVCVCRLGRVLTDRCICMRTYL